MLRSLRPTPGLLLNGDHMLHVDITLEDLRLVARRNCEGKWIGEITDHVTGREQVIQWNDCQLGAVLALAAGAGEEGFDANATTALYAVAEPLFSGVDKTFRMIP